MSRSLLFFTFIIFFSSLSAATFESNVANGSWSVASSWAITIGVDGDGIPDSDDNVIIKTGHKINLNAALSTALSITIQNGGILNFGNASRSIHLYGNYTIQGGTTSGAAYIYLLGGSGNIISSTSTFNTNCYFRARGSNISIAAGTTINLDGYISLDRATTNVTNNGTINITGNGNVYFNNAAATWTNASGSVLRLTGNVLGNGIFNCSTASNYVVYNGANQSVYPTTYYNLNISALAGTTYLQGNIIVLNDLNLYNTALYTFDASNNNITIGGSWYNYRNTNVLNFNTITFNGTGAQSINRTSTETFRHLTYSGTGTLTLNRSIICTGNFSQTGSGTFNVSTFDMQVRGNWNRTAGTFNPQTRTVTFNGTAAQTISGTVATNFYNITSSNAAGVSFTSGVYTVSNIMTSSSGTLANTGGTVTLVSNSSKIAVVGNGAGSYSGTYILQRYISARAANWHEFSSQVTSTTVADWDGAGYPGEMYMSGVGGPDGNACCPKFYSVRRYNEPTGTWINITSTATVLTQGKGYLIYFGDDLITWTATRMVDTRGTPSFGSPSVALSYTGGSPDPGANLVGNPHHSHIDWSLVTKTGGVDGTIWMLDDGTYNGYAGATIIPPMQGFWVYATAGGNSISFPQSCKTTSTATTFHKQLAPENELTLHFYSDEATPFKHRIHFRFDEEATTEYDNGKDAWFLKSPNETAPEITIPFKNNRELIRCAFNPTQDVESFPLRTKVGANGKYKISAEHVEKLNQFNCVILEDLFNGEKIDFKNTPVYEFEITELDNPNRFVIHFVKNQDDCEKIKTTAPQQFFNESMVQIFNTQEGPMIKFDLDSEEISTIEIYSLLGSLIDKSSVSAFKQSILLNKPLNSGLYIIKVAVGGNTVSKKVFIN